MRKRIYISPSAFVHQVRLRTFINEVYGNKPDVDSGGEFAKERGFLGIDGPENFEQKGIWDDLQ